MADKNMQTKVVKKVNSSSVFALLIPYSGCISYELLSIRYTAPIEISRMIGRRTALYTEIAFCTAHFGFGLFLYHQKFLSTASTPWRISHTVLCTVMFNFGSSLLWMTVSILLPKKGPFAKMALGLFSGLLFLSTGKNLINHLNRQVK